MTQTGSRSAGSVLRRRLAAAAVACALVALMPAAGPAHQSRTFICGSRSVDVGDYKFEVIDRCGEPLYSEIIGYRLNRRGEREMKVEQWVYGPLRGLYYVLEFEGGRLLTIESRIKRP